MSEDENLTYDEEEEEEELLQIEEEEPFLEEIKEEALSTNEAMLQELKLIREQLVPKEEELDEEIKKKRFLRKFGEEFILFIRKYKVLGLAVAFIMATYIGLLVQALVDDIIMPIFQYIPGLKNLDQLSEWKVGNFLIGDFLSVSVTFLVISFVIFLIVKAGSRVGLETD